MCLYQSSRHTEPSRIDVNCVGTAANLNGVDQDRYHVAIEYGEWEDDMSCLYSLYRESLGRHVL